VNIVNILILIKVKEEYISMSHKRRNLRHPKREEVNKASPKRLQNIFSNTRVIYSTVFVFVQCCYSMWPYISHLSSSSSSSSSFLPSCSKRKHNQSIGWKRERFTCQPGLLDCWEGEMDQKFKLKLKWFFFFVIIDRHNNRNCLTWK